MLRIGSFLYYERGCADSLSARPSETASVYGVAVVSQTCAGGSSGFEALGKGSTSLCLMYFPGSWRYSSTLPPEGRCAGTFRCVGLCVRCS